LTGISDLSFKLGGMLHLHTFVGTKFFPFFLRHDETRDVRPNRSA